MLFLQNSFEAHYNYDKYSELLRFHKIIFLSVLKPSQFCHIISFPLVMHIYGQMYFFCHFYKKCY